MNTLLFYKIFWVSREENKYKQKYKQADKRHEAKDPCHFCNGGYPVYNRIEN